MSLVEYVRGLPLSECRDCHEPIRFVRLDTGKAMPVDPVPVLDRGNVCARRLGNELNGYVVSKDHPADPLFLRFLPHHASCEALKNKQTPEPGDLALF